MQIYELAVILSLKPEPKTEKGGKIYLIREVRSILPPVFFSKNKGYVYKKDILKADKIELISGGKIELTSLRIYILSRFLL